jgi:hypothetical protein
VAVEPTAGRRVQHVIVPVVPGATWTVACSCGYAHDAIAATGAEAIAQFIERHRHEGAAFTAKEIPT